MKNYWFENKDADANGTSLQFRVSIDQDFIWNHFGPSHFLGNSIDDKVLAEWIFENQDGKVATLYDWKGSSQRNEWHIGAHDAETAHLFEIWLSNFHKREMQKQKIRA